MYSSGRVSPRIFESSCCNSAKSAADAVLLLGGAYKGKSESYSCDQTFGDIGVLGGLSAAVLNQAVYYCGGVSQQDCCKTKKDCFKMKEGQPGRRWQV